MKKIILGLTFILSFFSLAACDGFSVKVTNQTGDTKTITAGNDKKQPDETSYSVKFIYIDVTNSKQDEFETKVKSGETVKQPENKSEGYAFEGWYTDLTGSKKYDFSSKVTSDLTLYAILIEECKITFETNGGFINNFLSDTKEPNVKHIEKGSTLTKPENPIKEGFKFKGWFTDKDLTKEYSFNSTVTSDLTLYAKWEETKTVTTYTVDFNSNGGSDVTSQNVNSDEKVTKPADPTKKGYTFKGWFTDKDLTKEYSFNSTVTSDLTLYAKWEEEKIVTTYTVTFNSEGGSTVTSKKVEEGQNVTKPTNPTRTGCKFGGWYTSYEYSEEFDFTQKITENKTLYAKWIINGSPITSSATSKIFNNGVSLYMKMNNTSGIDIYYLENVNITVKNKSTNYMCAQASFGNVKPKNYILNGATIDSWDFFFGTDCCDLPYWKNNSFTYTYSMGYDAIVLPNELKTKTNYGEYNL